METSQILGWAATALFTICYIPQILKTRKTGTIDGLSFWLLFLSFLANIIAFWYSILIDQGPLQIKYTLGLLFLAITIYYYLKVWKSNKHNGKKNEIHNSFNPTAFE